MVTLRKRERWRRVASDQQNYRGTYDYVEIERRKEMKA